VGIPNRPKSKDPHTKICPSVVNKTVWLRADTICLAIPLMVLGGKGRDEF